MSERAPTVHPDDTEQRLRSLEGKLSAIIGFEGVPGWIQRVESEQTRSATSQGQRLEELKTAVFSRFATLEQTVSTTREATNDTRARLAAGIAVVLALVSAAGVIIKVLT